MQRLEAHRGISWPSRRHHDLPEQAAQAGGAGDMALSPASPELHADAEGDAPSMGSGDARRRRRSADQGRAGGAVTVVSRVRLGADPDAVFAFHADVRNLPRLTPGPMRVVQAAVPTREGDVQVIEIGAGPWRRRWHARVERFEPPALIVDRQERGPFRLWRHAHAVRPVAGGALLVDAVQFRFLPGATGRLLDALVVAPALRLLFAVRHRRTRRSLERGRSGR
jgi:ligand-binding SRPBCC domain-containing protein